MVRKVKRDPDNPAALIIHIKRSLLNTEALHFPPSGGSHDELTKELEQRIAR